MEAEVHGFGDQFTLLLKAQLGRLKVQHLTSFTAVEASSWEGALRAAARSISRSPHWSVAQDCVEDESDVLEDAYVNILKVLSSVLSYTQRVLKKNTDCICI